MKRISILTLILVAADIAHAIFLHMNRDHIHDYVPHPGGHGIYIWFAIIADFGPFLAFGTNAVFMLYSLVKKNWKNAVISLGLLVAVILAKCISFLIFPTLT